MEVMAKSKYVRLSPRKLRLVADVIRGMEANQALVILENLNKKGAISLRSVLKQGMANAVNNFQLKKESLFVKTVEVGRGPAYKRMDKSHRAFRWGTLKKPTAHIRLVLSGEKEEAKKASLAKGKKKGKKDGPKS